MNQRTLLLLFASLLLTAPSAAATDGTSVAADDDCGIICCFQDNAVDRAQCTGDYFVVAVAPTLPGSTGSTVLAYWGATNTAIDNVQKDGGDVLCDIFTCPDLPVGAASQSIVCEDTPAGWTVCFVAGIVLGPSYWCTGKIDVNWVQCVANGEIDHAQAYEQKMCDYVFQPRICSISPVSATAATGPLALPATHEFLLNSGDIPCLCCYHSLAETAQCFADLLVRGAVPNSGLGAVILGYWSATMGAYDAAQPVVDDTQYYTEDQVAYIMSLITP